jgi:hypothetical protein
MQSGSQPHSISYTVIQKRYVILNVQKEIDEDDNSIKYIYREVGSWNNDQRLVLDTSMIKFPQNERIYTSVCSVECGFGHVKVRVVFFGMMCIKIEKYLNISFGIAYKAGWAEVLLELQKV